MHTYSRHLGDYAKDTKHLTLLEHGAYTVLMDYCYATERALPKDENILHRICGAFTKPEQQAVSSVIQEFFTLTDHGWTQKRIEQELMKAHEKSGKAKQASLTRWNANAMQTHSERITDAQQTDTARNADGMPRVRALRNPHPISISNPPNPRQRGKSGKLTEPLFPEDIPTGYIEPLTRWFTYKQERREGYTLSGWQALISQQQAFPPSAVAASVQASMSSNWAGLFTDKIHTTPSFQRPAFDPEKKEGGGPPAIENPCPPQFEQACHELYGHIPGPWALLGIAEQADIRAWCEKERGAA